MSDRITATLPAEAVMHGKELTGEKRLCQTMSLIAMRDGKLVEPVTVRVWCDWSRSPSNNYASIWVHDHNQHFAGHGKASGWGYHRPSAALDAAIRAAGITLSKPIDGVGETAMHDAMGAIATALGFTTFRIAHHG